MHRQLAGLRDRACSPAWTLPLVIITSLCYALALFLVMPLIGHRARLVGYPFVWFWAWRSGVRGGVSAALAVILLLPNLISPWSGVPDVVPPPEAIVPLMIIHVTMGALVGRMSMLARHLRSELNARVRAEVLLRESEECYRLLFDSNPRPMWVSDRETVRFLAVNGAAIEHYGYSAEELDRMGLSSFLPPGDLPRPDLPGGRRHRKKDGTIIDVELAVHPITFRGREALLALATDITEQKRAQAALEYEAYHDTLTGLPNRASFLSSLARALEQARKTLEPFALFLMDLDRFKAINDTLGHAYGDQALRQIGPRIGKALRQGDVLARLGGDEFGLFLPGADESGALQVAARLLEAFVEPFVLDGRPFDVGSSVGIAIHPDHGETIDELLHRADIAMYASKRSRDGAVVYSPTLDELPSVQRTANGGDEALSLAGRISDDGVHDLDG